MHYLDPLWQTLKKLKLGVQSDLEMYSIKLLFRDEGICAFYIDPDDQIDQMQQLASLDRAYNDCHVKQQINAAQDSHSDMKCVNPFNHKVFDSDKSPEHI